jgi:hypothetical protein
VVGTAHGVDGLGKAREDILFALLVKLLNLFNVTAFVNLSIPFPYPTNCLKEKRK